MITLDELGNKICIIGPSCSGKSTLANKLAKKLSIPAIHLDQIAHKKDTNWEAVEFINLKQLHDSIIISSAWIIDGNYGRLMPQRIERSTSIIWIDPSLFGYLYRYMLRSLKNDINRPGNLQGAKSQFSLSLIKYTFFNYPNNKHKYNSLMQGYSNPVVMINSMKELDKYCKFWGL